MNRCIFSKSKAPAGIRVTFPINVTASAFFGNCHHQILGMNKLGAFLCNSGPDQPGSVNLNDTVIFSECGGVGQGEDDGGQGLYVHIWDLIRYHVHLKLNMLSYADIDRRTTIVVHRNSCAVEK